MTLEAFVLFCLSGDGVAVIIGLLLSWQADMWPGFSELGPVAKRWSILGACLFIALGLGVGVGVLVLHMPFDEQLLFAGLQAGFVGFAASQGLHAAKLFERSKATTLGQKMLEMYQVAAQDARGIRHLMPDRALADAFLTMVRDAARRR